ncbi:MAG: T9SS type A sorting domain-containing protein [Bacteroidia bacterium]
MKIFKILLFLILLPQILQAQFYNHQWLIGNQWLQTVPKGRMFFDSSSYQYLVEYRKMAFEGTQGNICNANGDFLMSSNGVWIANANNDSMLNGTGLNPGYFVNSYPNGLVIENLNFFIPNSDSISYTLFHQTNSDPNSSLSDLYYSTVDMSLDGGLGGVTNKNMLMLQDSLSLGITACKHANGRDWWIIAMKDESDIIYKFLYTPNGIVSVSTQNLNFTPFPHENVSQICFNNEGNLFAYNVYDNPVDRNSFVVLCDFDRCTGNFSNTRVIPVYSGAYIWGLSFSPNGDFLYSNTSIYVFQINITTLLVNTVAIYDGFSFPIPSAATTFWAQYLAANGKIYITSGNGVQHLHEINFPDSAGLACDVQQHAVSLGVWHFRTVPNHPNYNLGPVIGSVCDSLSIIGIEEQQHDFKLSISPNPTSDGSIKLIYLLPQNKNGVFEVYNITGQLVYKMNLPPWSTLQIIQLPELCNGVYTCVVKSEYERVGRKLVVMK